MMIVPTHSTASLSGTLAKRIKPVLLLLLMGGLMLMLYRRDGYIPTFLIAITIVFGLYITVPQLILCINYYLNDRRKLILVLAILFGITALNGFGFNGEPYFSLKYHNQQDRNFELHKKELFDFILSAGETYKLINSAIKQDYNLFFSGNIVEFDTLIIGKGFEKYLSDYIVITRDSIIFNKITRSKTTKAYEHNFRLKNSLSIRIDRHLESATVTLINEKDTLIINSDFTGMYEPFIRSLGSEIHVNEFKFTCNDYCSEIFVFGDSYVNCATPKRWPYYLYKKSYKFLCDGLPGGRSVDSYEFLISSLTVSRPEYIIWCLGMNDGSDKSGISSSWQQYIKEVMTLCEKNNITLILATVPSVPTVDNTEKNRFIRESGFRYIDFDKAVSDGNGKWRDGMLSNDGVHPTEAGAKAMAEQLIKDFPEIENYHKGVE